MLRLWGRANSMNVQKPMLCLEELGLAYERTDAGLAFGIVDTPAYRALNPNGVVPTLEDEGFVLWESNVVVRYLAAKYGAGSLYPADLQARFDLERWMDWQQTSLHGPFTTCFWGLVRAPGSKTEAELSAALKQASARFGILDRLLAERPWISGAQFGMADCVLAPCVHRWLNMPVPDRAPTPALERYYAAVMERPSARKVLILPLT